MHRFGPQGVRRVRKLGLTAIGAALLGTLAVVVPSGVAHAAPATLPDPITAACGDNNATNCWRYISFSDNAPPTPDPPSVQGNKLILNHDGFHNVGNGAWWNTPIDLTGKGLSVSFNAYLDGGDPNYHGSGMAFALVDSYMTPTPIPYFPSPINFGASGPGLGFNGFHGNDSPGAPDPSNADGHKNLAVTLITDNDDLWDNGNSGPSEVFNLSRVGLLHGRSWAQTDVVHQRVGSWYPDAPKDVLPSIYGGRAVPVAITLVPTPTPGTWDITVLIDGNPYYDNVPVDLPSDPVYLGFTSGTHERPNQHAISDVSVRYGPVETPTISATPNPADLGLVHVGTTSLPAPITIKNEGFADAMVSLASAPAGFAVSGLPVNLKAGGTAVLNTTFTPTTASAAGGNVVLTVSSGVGSGTSSFAVSGKGVTPDTPIGAPFAALAPTRILDTRQSGGPVAPGGVRTVPIAGVGNVPRNAAAVVMNVTVDQPTANGYVTVYPTGQPTPQASNLNFVRGQTIANLVTAKVGPDGAVNIYNFAGQTQVLFDVVGYFPSADISSSALSTSAAQGGEFVPVAPARILDTRSGVGAGQAPLGAGAQLDLQTTGAGPVPGAGVAAVVMNLTATNTTAPGYLTAWPTGSPMQTTSNLNFVAGQSVPNLAVIPVSDSGKVSIYNFAGNTDVIGDVVGYYTKPGVSVPGGGLFHAMAPQRFLDTRPEAGHATMANGQTVTAQITGRAGIPSDAVGVVANVTATNTTVPGFLTVFPDALPQPLTSSLNFVGGEPGVPNLVMSKLSGAGTVGIYNFSPGGTTDAIADVVGWYGTT
jgi:hypothetical protein